MVRRTAPPLVGRGWVSFLERYTGGNNDVLKARAGFTQCEIARGARAAFPLAGGGFPRGGH